MNVIEFLVQDVKLLSYLHPLDIVIFGAMVSRSLSRVCTKSLQMYRGSFVAPKWSQTQRKAWLTTDTPSPLILWHIHKSRCMLCHKNWYSYRRSLLPVGAYVHDICAFRKKCLVEDADQGTIIIPRFSSILHKDDVHYRLKG